MTISVLTGLLEKYCIMEQIESIVIRDNLMTVVSSRVIDVNKNKVQFITRTFKYNIIYAQWECLFTDYSGIMEE